MLNKALTHSTSKQMDANGLEGAAQPLSISAVLRHGLLMPARPPENGAGTAIFVSQMIRCFSHSDEFAEWKTEAEKLSKALRAAGVDGGSSATVRHNSNPLWEAVHKCLKARQESKMDVQSIDRLLARTLIQAAGGDFQITQEILRGITQLFNTSKLHRRELGKFEWRKLFDVMTTGQSLSEFILTLLPGNCRTFAEQADRLIHAPLPALSTTVTLRTLFNQEAARQPALPSSTEMLSGRISVQTETDTGEVDGNADELKIWRRGDSVSKHLAEQSPFTLRRIKLGAEVRSTTALAQLPGIARGLTARLLRASEPLEISACLLAILQAAFPVPAPVLLGIRLALREDDHLRFDKNSLCFHVRRGHMHPTSSETSAEWSIQIPTVVRAEFAKRFTAVESAIFLADLLLTEGVEEAELLRNHHELLRECSDINLQCWPGHWVHGLRAAAVSVLNSELLAAFTLAIPGLASAGSLHYFHPRQVDLDAGAKEWFDHLGLSYAASELHAGE